MAEWRIRRCRLGRTSAPARHASPGPPNHLASYPNNVTGDLLIRRESPITTVHGKDTRLSVRTNPFTIAPSSARARSFTKASCWSRCIFPRSVRCFFLLCQADPNKHANKAETAAGNHSMPRSTNRVSCPLTSGSTLTSITKKKYETTQVVMHAKMNFAKPTPIASQRTVDQPLPG